MPSSTKAATTAIATRSSIRSGDTTVPSTANPEAAASTTRRRSWTAVIRLPHRPADHQAAHHQASTHRRIWLSALVRGTAVHTG